MPMFIADIYKRVISKYRRLCANYLYRRTIAINAEKSYISFTFDDFPRSALNIAGVILKKYDCVGTYYVSLELAGKCDASGPMFNISDLQELYEQGHELGCHTFTHCDSSETLPEVFLASVATNREALGSLFSGATFRTFSFPKSAPRAITKRDVGKHFEGCRGGGQTVNVGVADLNYMRAFFLEQAGGDLGAVKQVIDLNRKLNGWLIFATHDVCENPSSYGCTPKFFEAVVKYAVDSESVILPVARVLDLLRRSSDASEFKEVSKQP